MATATTDYGPILKLLHQGYGPAHIIETLGLTISRRQIQRIAAKHGIERAHVRNGRLDIDRFVGPFRTIVEYVMIEVRGLDPYLCSECARRMTRWCDIHHTKYDGATVYDLAFICRRCNTAPKNVGLA